VNQAVVLEGELELECEGNLIRLQGSPDGCQLRFKSLGDFAGLAMRCRQAAKSMVTLQPVDELLRIHVFVGELRLLDLSFGFARQQPTSVKLLVLRKLSDF